MSYVGLSGAEMSRLMGGAMDDAVRVTANRIEKTAKKYAPVRKIFQERGAARMEERTFVDEGLPKNLRKSGSRPTRKVVTMTVRSHRANRMSTSAANRQDFRIVSAAEAHDRRIVAGHIIHTLKPNVIEVYQPFSDTKPTYAMFEGGSGKVSARGRYEVAQAMKGYAASVEEHENVTPTARTITEPYQPGKPGGYPRGTKVLRKKDGTLVARFERVTTRQTVIRVRHEKRIRQIVSYAAKERKGTRMPTWKGPSLYRSKPTAANPKGQLRIAGPDRSRPGYGSRKATPGLAERWTKHEKQVRKVKRAQAKVDDTFGGLNSRAFAARMTPFQEPYGAFKGAVLGTHFKLQVGGLLRESIEAEELGRAKARVRAGVYYAVYQEFGTSHHPAHPFLRPALYENRVTLKQQAKAKGGRAVQKMRKG